TAGIWRGRRFAGLRRRAGSRWPLFSGARRRDSACGLTSPGAAQGPRLSWTIYGVSTAQFGHRRAGFLDRCFAAAGVEHVGDPVGDLFELALLEAARRAGRGADADAAGHHRRPRVVRHGILVDRDVRLAERGVGIFPGDVLVGQIEQEEMIVGAAAHDAVIALDEPRAHGPGVHDHLLLVV